MTRIVINMYEYYGVTLFVYYSSGVIRKDTFMRSRGLLIVLFEAINSKLCTRKTGHKLRFGYRAEQ